MAAPIRACVFDAYGTLFDFASAAARCADTLSEKGKPLAALWRDKQLQYSWLRGLQGRYAPFWQVTQEALDFSLEALGLDGDAELRERLLAAYRTLGAFPEVPDMLKTLRERGFSLAILSNGSPDMLESALEAAGLVGAFDHVLSVDALGTFKPDPRVYEMAVEVLGVPAEAISFQSSNSWDAHAAGAFGMRVVWCNRYGQGRDRLPGRIAHEIRTLAELPALLGDPAAASR